MAGRLSGTGYGKGRRAAGEPEVRVELRKDEGPGPSIRVVLCNGRPGHDDIDLTRSFTSAIAHCLWMARAGDDAQNWIEAERLLERLLADKAQRAERRAAERAEPVGPLPEPGLILGRMRRDVVGSR
jgi:hypothetical protein